MSIGERIPQFLSPVSKWVSGDITVSYWIFIMEKGKKTKLQPWYTQPDPSTPNPHKHSYLSVGWQKIWGLQPTSHSTSEKAVLPDNRFVLLQTCSESHSSEFVSSCSSQLPWLQPGEVREQLLWPQTHSHSAAGASHTTKWYPWNSQLVSQEVKDYSVRVTQKAVGR